MASIVQQISLQTDAETVSATSYAAIANIVHRYWDADLYDGTVTIYFEATLDPVGSSRTAYAALYDGAGNQVSGSEIITDRNNDPNSCPIRGYYPDRQHRIPCKSLQSSRKRNHCRMPTGRQAIRHDHQDCNLHRLYGRYRFHIRWHLRLYLVWMWMDVRCRHV